MSRTLRYIPLIAASLLILAPTTLAHASVVPYCSSPARSGVAPVGVTGSSRATTTSEMSELTTRANALESLQNAAPSAQLRALLGEDYQVNAAELATVVDFHTLLGTPTAKGFLFALQADEQTLSTLSVTDHQLYGVISSATTRICAR